MNDRQDIPSRTRKHHKTWCKEKQFDMSTEDPRRRCNVVVRPTELQNCLGFESHWFTTLAERFSRLRRCNRTKRNQTKLSLSVIWTWFHSETGKNVRETSAYQTNEVKLWMTREIQERTIFPSSDKCKSAIHWSIDDSMPSILIKIKLPHSCKSFGIICSNMTRSTQVVIYFITYDFHLQEAVNWSAVKQDSFST